MENVRNKAWRKFKAKLKSGKRSNNQRASEKNWKLIYTRGEKLRRARQLKVEYPKRTVRQILDDEQPLEIKT
ncbi:MAG: hypothetical protein ACRBHB_16580 [Arenicella sp.]